MANTESNTPTAEGRYHHYRGNVIPWFVRFMWLAFWIFTIVYTVKYLFPALQVELLQAQ